MATPDLHRGMEINSKEIEYASAIQTMVLYTRLGMFYCHDRRNRLE
ncbi:MAG: hypothetical protein AAB116_10325 [Candidatus Poribacteria bacterium]